jgi:hypothetical protein
MSTLSYTVTLSGMGAEPITKTQNRSDDGGLSLDIAVPASPAGTLTTRTDNDTGTVTMSSGGHGITTGQVVDLYWVGGARYGVTVGTVSGTSVPIDAGSGDNLPIATTAIIVAPRVAFNAAIDGDALSLIGLQLYFADQSSTERGYIRLVDAADDVIANVVLAANVPRVWDIDAGDTNSFSGDPITDGFVSNSSSTAAATLRLRCLQDATP